MDNCYAVRAVVVIDSLVIPNTTMIEYHLKEQSELATLVLKPIAPDKKTFITALGFRVHH